jgi:hypothetical protein
MHIVAPERIVNRSSGVALATSAWPASLDVIPSIPLLRRPDRLCFTTKHMLNKELFLARPGVKMIAGVS